MARFHGERWQRKGDSMAYEQILTEVRGRVGVLRLNRPEKLNAWTDQMATELAEQIEAWNADDAIGAILLAGEGRAFCAGADLQGFNNRLETDPDAQGAGVTPDAPAAGRRENWTDLIRRSKPVVAAIQGYAVGVGLTMVLPCDVRFAADDARLSIRFVRVGLVPELGSTRLLAQLAGLGAASDMCLTGRMVPAEEAYRIGLVSAVVAKDELFETALAKAEEIANNPTTVVRVIKGLLAENTTEADLGRVMEREGARDRECRRLPSHREAVTAFLEKREPVFNR